jgi:hypothetical protein
MSHAYEREEMHKIFWQENVKGRDYSEDLGMNGITEKEGGKLWTGFM